MANTGVFQFCDDFKEHIQIIGAEEAFPKPLCLPPIHPKGEPLWEKIKSK